jgi:hypothetical protein
MTAFHQRPAMHAHRRKQEIARRAPERAQRLQGVHVFAGVRKSRVEWRATNALPKGAAPPADPIAHRLVRMLALDIRRSAFDFMGRA